MYNFSMLLDDDIYKSIEDKIKVFNKFLINNIEINDFIENKNITELNNEEIEKIRNLLINYNKKIVLLNCNDDISKYNNYDNYEYYKTLFKNAYMLGIENIKAGFNLDISSDSGSECNEAKKCLELILKLGNNYGIGVLIENKSYIACTQEYEIAKICNIWGIDKNNIELIFNPLEYVKLKKHPFFHVFYNSKLKNNVLFLRVTDGLYKDGSSALPGQGNGELKEMASALLARGFKGYFSFTNYYKDVDIGDVIKTFKSILMDI
mgnify:CR=1 FL=1